MMTHDITKEAVWHRAEVPFSYPVGADALKVTLRARRGEISRCYALFDDRYEQPGAERIQTLQRVGSDELFDYFQGTLRLELPRFRYVFYLRFGDRGVWYGERGFSQERPHDGFFQYPYINRADLFDVPGWVADSVFYHIFPERFANGDPTNDPPGARPWDQSRPSRSCHYGGDLQGIIDRLPYLQDLGVTAIYLNPIFAAPTNHKYDTTDYYRIDPQFGDIDTFKRLVRACHDAGMRVVLDAVFNHCGKEFFAFRDVMEKGADSPYAGWFHIRDFPVRTRPEPNYETFANGIADMPKLRTENPEVRAYLLDVARYWIEECDIDGWRIDVANEVDHDFWRAFRRTVRKAKPDAYIVGEIWHEARPWLLGDQYDGVTNYLVRDLCVDFFAKDNIDATGFDAGLTRVRMAYPKPMLEASWNLLGSHDTARFLTLCGGDERRMALALTFLFTYVGTPVIYYGDEVGMEGKNDPDCRRPMIWEEGQQNHGLLALCRRLVALRKEHPALRRGDVRTLAADPLRNVFVYWRGDDREEVIVALNNSPKRVEAAVPAPVTQAAPASAVYGDAGEAKRPGREQAHRTWTATSIGDWTATLAGSAGISEPKGPKESRYELDSGGRIRLTLLPYQAQILVRETADEASDRGVVA